MTELSEEDFNPKERSPAQLIDALGRARRESRRDLAAQVALLADHDDPLVREEALSTLLSSFGVRAARWRALAALHDDPDFGVRSQAAISLSRVSADETKREDSEVLAAVVRNELEDPAVRRAAYDGLLLVHDRVDTRVDSRRGDFIDSVDWAWLAEISGK
jgi:HEAT repeat protein